MWTTNSYDALGRVINVKTPDNAQMKTIYSGNEMTAIDPAGKDRQSVTDALGRVVKVVEDPGTGGLGLVTEYTYDALDHLLTVSQGEQTRTLVYDSLSRLISSTNPENGTLAYQSDDDGNLLKRTDERAVSASSQVKVAVSYTYDELNRVKSRSYNDGTPAVAYFYDNETLPSGYALPSGFTRGAATGRLVAVTYGGGSAGNYLSYDKLGRVTQSVQQTDGTNYGLSYQYNLAGEMTSESYPSGRVVRTAYDSVGRLSQVTGEKGGTIKTYASGFGYASHGALSKVKLGNNLWEHTTYDAKRLQVTEIGLGISASDSSQLKLSYNYLATPTATTNNGDVLSQTISAPGINLTQSFTYDELNRLSTSLEKQGSSVVWRENFTYDRYGNRRIDEAGTTPALVGPNPEINPANNRISSMVNNQVTGYQYDAVGNMIADPGHSYTFDGESRLVSYGAQTPASYSYDGTGQRVKKVVGTGSLAVTTTFVYDAGGKLIAEYGTNTAGSATGTSYVTVDRLGSTRLLTNGVIQKGVAPVKARYDYMPFGEEISSSYGNRSSAPGYNPPEGMRQKYTGYERDLESGLDFAQARYYANTQGRFISADSVGGSATSPQSLNRYAYTGNNPVNNIDPSGHVFFGAQFNSSQSYGDEASPGYPDYAEAGMSQEMLEKYASMKDINNQDRAAAVAESVAGLFELGNADAQSGVTVSAEVNAPESAHASGGAEQTRKTIYTDDQIKGAVGVCTSTMFGVDFVSMQFSALGKSGSFTGNNQYGSEANSEIIVVNEVNAFSGAKLAALDRKFGGSSRGSLNGLTIPYKINGVETGFTPYRNFTAKNRGTDSRMRGVSSWKETQIWELGNSLQMITEFHNGSSYNNPKKEPGLLFQNCVKENLGR